MSAGLLSGGALGAVGLAMGAAIGGALTSAGSLLWLVGAVVAGVGLFLLAILPREDLGSTLPTAIVVGALGLTRNRHRRRRLEGTDADRTGGFTDGAVSSADLLAGRSCRPGRPPSPGRIRR